MSTEQTPLLAPCVAQPLVIARVGGLIAKSIRENMHKLRVIRLSAAARAVQLTWVTRWHRTYHDGMSDGFRELL